MFVMRHLGAGAESFPTRLLSEIRLQNMYVHTFLGGAGKSKWRNKNKLQRKEGRVGRQQVMLRSRHSPKSLPQRPKTTAAVVANPPGT